MSLSVKEIQHSLYHDLRVKGWRYWILNSKCFSRYEGDFFGITRAMFVTEFEIKRSRSDYQCEFTVKTKKDKHYFLAQGKLVPNYFYFVCEKGLIKKEEVPEHVGLIYVEKYEWKKKINYQVTTIIQAPRLHTKKLTEKNLIIALRSMMYKVLENLLK